MPVNNKKKNDFVRANHLVEILDSFNDGVFTLDREWYVTYSNRIGASNLGLEPQEFIGQYLWKRFPQLINTEIELYFRKVMDSGQYQEFDIQGIFSPKWYNIRVYPSTEGIIVYSQDVTERKKTEEGLREIEEFRSALLNNSPHPIVVRNADRELIFVNPAFEKMTGFTASEIMGSKYPAPWWSDDDLAVYLEGKWKPRVSWSARETRFKHKNGQQFWIQISNGPVIKDGKLRYIISQWVNIDDRKKAEQALLESEKLRSILLNNSPYPIIFRNEKQEVIFVNPAFEKMTGFTAAEVMGTNLPAPFWSEEYTSKHMAGRLSPRPSQNVIETRFKKKNGELFWVQLTNSPVIQGGKQKYNIIQLVDINDRIKAEEALRYQALLVDNAFDAIVSSDMSFRIKSWNNAAERIFGWKAEEAIGKNLRDVIKMESDSETYDYIRQSIISKGFWQGEVVRQRKDGTPLNIFVSISEIKDGLGQPIGFIGINRDITERKKAEEALIKYKEELEFKVKERTQELEQVNEQLKQYGLRITQIQEEERKRIAYELHDDTAQYLSILKMELGSLLHSGKIKDPRILEKLEFLEKDANRAFIDVRRYSHELRPGVLEHLGLLAALEQIAEDTNILKQINVKLKVDGVEPKMSEEVKLGLFRISQEALNNARKHAGASKVLIDLHYRDNQVKMVVNDNGAGFNVEDTLAHLGERDSLGLMSMQERAKLIKADLRIESKPGKGTKVIVIAKV